MYKTTEQHLQPSVRTCTKHFVSRQPVLPVPKLWKNRLNMQELGPCNHGPFLRNIIEDKLCLAKRGLVIFQQKDRCLQYRLRIATMSQSSRRRRNRDLRSCSVRQVCPEDTSQTKYSETQKNSNVTNNDKPLMSLNKDYF